WGRTVASPTVRQGGDAGRGRRLRLAGGRCPVRRRRPTTGGWLDPPVPQSRTRPSHPCARVPLSAS
ncbi:MAG: hypothetical protein AVDCRST_MAG20-2838, partial [uncultured Acidimicrobiales bacterium]